MLDPKLRQKLSGLSAKQWKQKITEMFEFEQTVLDGKREVRIVLPKLDDVPLDTYTVTGDEARRRIIRFVCAMAGGYFILAGYPQLEQMIHQIAVALAGPDGDCHQCDEQCGGTEDDGVDSDEPS